MFEWKDYFTAQMILGRSYDLSYHLALFSEVDVVVGNVNIMGSGYSLDCHILLKHNYNKPGNLNRGILKISTQNLIKERDFSRKRKNLIIYVNSIGFSLN